MKLDVLLEPRSVAVVGVGRRVGGIGRAVFQALISGGFTGPLWPINPKAADIDGRPCFPDVASLPGVPDLCVIAVPAAGVPGVMTECAAAKVPAAVVISAGFKESGPEGGALEREVGRIARAGGVRVLGPNCLGLMVPSSHLNASFAGDMVPEGRIAVVTQSGALGTAILDWARARGGLAGFVSLGNRADLTETDFIDAFADKPEVTVIAGYLESVADGATFVERIREVTAKMPVLLLKAGSSEAGARAVSSHTGSLAGSDAAYDAAFHAAGVIRATDIEHLFDASEAFSLQPLPAGPGLVILTNAGGPAVMATDACERQHVALASLEDATVEALRVALPPAAAVYNPVDILGDAEPARYEAALRILLADPGVTSILVLLTPQQTTLPIEVADIVARLSKGSDRTTLASFLGEDAVEPARAKLAAAGVPAYRYPEQAVDALASMHAYRAIRSRVAAIARPIEADRETVRAVIAEARAARRAFLLDVEVFKVAAAYGIPLAPGSVARRRSDAVRIATQIGYPVALKVSSPDILHKTDVGGVAVGIADEAQLTAAWDSVLDHAHRRMPDAQIWGALVQKMSPPGVEVVIGMERDATFGPLVMFGSGGILVEVLHDVAFRLAPLDGTEALRMIEQTRAHTLLRGARGAEPADIDAVVDVLTRISALAIDFPEIVELDVNPLIVGARGAGAVAADIRIGIGG